MSPPGQKYVVVTPVRDEEEFVAATIEGVVAQTIRPAEWVLVDDGSTDETGLILERYADQYDWIRAIHRDNRGFRSDGGGIEAFAEGVRRLRTTDWEYLVNLDADLFLEPDYFERCLAEFRDDPKLGIGGGDIYNRVEGSLRPESHPLFHVRGATKIYRRECWQDIDGVYERNGWDTVDEVKANMLGWSTRSFRHIHLVQERATGDGLGQWSNWVKNGRANYVVGYHPAFLLAKAVKRLFRRPYAVASFGVLWGFFTAPFARVERIDDPKLIAYLRGQQLRRLLGRDTIWR